MKSLLRHSNYFKKISTFLHFFFSPSIRMSGKNIIFKDESSNKSNFDKNKKLSKIDDIDVNKILVSKKELYSKKSSFKYFIEYNDDGVIRSLCIKLPQMIGYVKCFESNKTMSFRLLIKKC